MPRKSIRFRFLAWFGFLLAALIVGFGITAYHLQRNATLGRIDAELEEQVDLLSAAFRGADVEAHFPHGDRGRRGRIRGERPPEPPLGPPPGLSGPLPGMPPAPEAPVRRTVRLPASVTNQFAATNRNLFAIWSAEDVLLARSSAKAQTLSRPEGAGDETRILHRIRGTWREAYHFTERRDCVLVGRDIAAELASLRHYAWMLALIGACILALGLGGGFLFSALFVRSIGDMCRAAQRISEGNLSERISAADMDRELGQLADVLNATFARLDAAFSRQRQFTADAAHELRTPLAVIITDAQTALRRERSLAEYRDTILACEEAAQQMRRLTESLLELARLDECGPRGARVATNLAELARAQMERLASAAAARQVELRAELQPAILSCHPEQIGLVFANLIANAIEYNKPGGTVRVSTRVEAQDVVAAVADSGRGIAPEDLPRIFDRFFRTSQTRASADGHNGLWLAICKSIMHAHGGSIEVASQVDQGSTFTLRWPLESANR